MRINFLLVLASALCVGVPAAHADVALMLFDGATCQTSNCVTIDQAGNFTLKNGIGSASGVVHTPTGYLSATVSVGTIFTLNAETAEGYPLFPDGQMDLTTNNVIALGAGTLHIWWSADDVQKQGSVNLGGGGTVDGPASVTYNVYADAGNNLFAPTTLLGTLGPFTDGAYSGSTTGLAVPGAPYALMQELVITTTGTSHLSGDFSVGVPEPGAITLLGCMLTLCGVILRKRAV